MNLISQYEEELFAYLLCMPGIAVLLVYVAYLLRGGWRRLCDQVFYDETKTN